MAWRQTSRHVNYGSTRASLRTISSPEMQRITSGVCNFRHANDNRLMVYLCRNGCNWSLWPLQVRPHMLITSYFAHYILAKYITTSSVDEMLHASLIRMTLS